MKSQVLLIAFFSILSSPIVLYGQVWESTYGGTGTDIGHSVQQTTDGGYIIAGETNLNEGNGRDVYLFKADENGVEQWNQTFGGTEVDRGFSFQQTTDGGYIITGFTLTFGSGGQDVYLIKTDGNGVEQWNQTFGGTDDDSGNSVQQTTDGGYIIAGRTKSFGSGSEDAYLIKTDGNGVEQWNKTFGGTQWESGSSVQQTTDGGYIIAGITGSFGNGNGDVYLIKTDGNGAEQWNQTFGGTGADRSHSVQQTTDGGYIIAGETGSFGSESQDVYLIKTNGDGVEQWNQTFGGTQWESGSSVQQTTDGGYIIAGRTNSFGSGNQDVYLIKTDGNGVEQWNQTFGGTESDSGNSVQQTIDGGYIIAGETSSFGSESQDVYLIKTDSEGTLSSYFTIPTSPSNRKLKNVVDLLGREVTKTPNQILFYIFDDGTVEKKFVVE